ncbi:MAG TPA: hypothetical protein VMU89_10750 [Thermomicrobiaceae bacterium]|nr:hypothetical protein [Thermomicrobiaceae bacterium]
MRRHDVGGGAAAPRAGGAIGDRLALTPVPRCRSVVLLLAFWPRICGCPAA